MENCFKRHAATYMIVIFWGDGDTGTNEDPGVYEGRY